MRTPLSIDAVEHDGTLTLVVQGELDISTAPLLDERLTEARVIGATTVVVDVDQVDFMDSTGLQVLIKHALPGAGPSENRLFLTRGSRPVRRLFEISGMLDHLPFVPSG